MNRKKEAGIIIVAGIVFIAGILSIIKNIAPVSALCFTLESVLLLWLGIRLSGEPKPIETEADVDMLENIRVLEQDKIELRQRIYALENEIEEKERGLGENAMNALSEKKELEDKLNDLENREKKESCEAFLPPIESSEGDNETIDIIKIARDTANELIEYAKEAYVEVVISTNEESLMVKGNASRMRIMFKNIIDNSIKYMKKAGNLVITISSIGDDIFVVCKDNGKGLDSMETEHIFELNFQGSNRISGNGLGLTQAKAIVDYYGGTIYAKSNTDKGMGIYIQLPTT